MNPAPAPLPSNEEARLKALARYHIVDTEAEEEFDALTAFVSEFLDVPITLISLLDESRQWFKSRIGLEVESTAREVSFCQYAILQQGIYEVRDALRHDLFQSNPLVQCEPRIRFYAGAPLQDSQGYNLGTLCVIDRVPRELSTTQRKILTEYAKSVTRLIEKRITVARLN